MKNIIIAIFTVFIFTSSNADELTNKISNIIADLRYGTLPHDHKSLWGIQVNVNNQDIHVSFENLRNFVEKN